MLNKFSRFIVRWSGTIALLGTVLGIVAGYYSVLLYKNLRTDIEELLPTTARSVLDLGEVTRRLESIDNLSILVFSNDPKASKQFVIDLATELQKVPQTTIASVEYRMDRELKFFKDRLPLFMGLEDLMRIRDYIRDRIHFEKQLYNPVNVFRTTEELPEPILDFVGLRKKYEGQVSNYERLPGGFYATPDERIRVVQAFMPGKISSMDQVHRLKEAVETAIKRVHPARYSKDIEIKYTGGVQDILEEHSALIADLELSTILVVIVVTLAMLVYYRNFRATIALVMSLFMGTLWTFGISYFAVGYLNANSAFLGSIVIGNGINFGIIFLARYLEERRNSKSNEEAIRISILHTSTATWTAALAAGLAYGSLMLTGFRGFKQFGVIGLIGMILCWISAFTMMPAYLTLMDRIKRLVREGENAPRAYLSEAVARVIERFPGFIALASVMITLLSLASLTKFTPEILETNLTKLRNKNSLVRGSWFLSKHLDEVFGNSMTPVVILTKTRDEARIIAEKLKERKKLLGTEARFDAVSTLDDFLPPQQKEKIQVLQEIRHILPPRIYYRMSEADQKQVSRLFNQTSLTPFGEKELPPLVMRKFTEKNGTVGSLVLVVPPLDGTTWIGEKLIEMVTALRTIADSVAPGTPVAGTYSITVDMIESVSHDGPKATLIAFIAVMLLVVVLFRNIKTVGLTLFALVLGVLWLAGFIFGFGHKINFLNFIALPITFGIGVDYGVNIFQRFREEGSRSIMKVIRNTGGAVGLCSFTTIVGYTSLLIAENQGFVSFGLLAVAGELTCVVAAIFTLPSILYLLDRRKMRRDARALSHTGPFSPKDTPNNSDLSESNELSTNSNDTAPQPSVVNDGNV